jgi:hypothetical protein
MAYVMKQTWLISLLLMTTNSSNASTLKIRKWEKGGEKQWKYDVNQDRYKLRNEL